MKFLTWCPTMIDIYLITKSLYNLNLVQQDTRLNHEVRGGVPFPHRLHVKRSRQYMYSTTIFPIKTHISKKRSRRIQIRYIEELFDRICTCICLPSKIAFSVDTWQYNSSFWWP